MKMFDSRIVIGTWVELKNPPGWREVVEINDEYTLIKVKDSEKLYSRSHMIRYSNSKKK